MVRHTLKILQDFESVFGHLRTLCIEGLMSYQNASESKDQSQNLHLVRSIFHFYTPKTSESQLFSEGIETEVHIFHITSFHIQGAFLSSFLAR